MDNQMKRVIIGAGAVALALAATGYAAASTGDGSAAPAASGTAGRRTVTTLDGYELGGDVKSAAAFSGNDLVFDGTVAGPAEPARRVRRTVPGGGRIDYVYTPVPVRVDKVRKGTGVRAGQTVRVRVLGGAVGSYQTVSSLGPRARDLTRGLKVTLFTQPLVDAGDGLKAVTPNFAFGYTPDRKNVYSIGPEGFTRKTPGGSFAKALKSVR
ncbi:hypothetical protein [Actinomadura parmotrematis]|uniref:Uncharacterized protein n=1 Tax=Actinomadura parmotrematis TaxID=2864039 RepID=A0ABS7FXT2_9ACTN|nr:hypothetical protein [Actinomadura parmotrematis]MBW8484407.1 hypothetical protein [Actinomadura parmotrematis]